MAAVVGGQACWLILYPHGPAAVAAVVAGPTVTASAAGLWRVDLYGKKGREKEKEQDE
jgi:hypothetical protein